MATQSGSLEQVAADRGWESRLILSSPNFARLLVTSPEESVLVDLAVGHA
jgi:hypothetical protein